MQLAIWDFPPAKYLTTATRSLDIIVEKQTGARCVDLLNQQQVDVALLPVNLALSSVDEFEILSGGAISSWGYPLAQVRIHHELQQAVTLKSSPEQILETFMVRVILKEHYGRKIQVVSEGDADLELLSQTDSVISTSKTLNLGREWYELAQYPMVWALYCCRKGTGTEAMIQRLIAMTQEAEAVAQDHQTECSEEQLRFRLDDVAIAGLTVIQEYMYYYGITKDLAPVQIFKPEEAQDAPWWAQGTGR